MKVDLVPFDGRYTFPVYGAASAETKQPDHFAVYFENPETKQRFEAMIPVNAEFREWLKQNAH